MKTSEVALTDTNVLENFDDHENDDKDSKSLSSAIEKSLVATYSIKFIIRFVDVMAGIVGVFFLAILIPIIYIANIASKDNGPVFYFQERIGKNGKIFKIFKFRSMCVNSEEVLEEYLKNNEDAKKEWKEYKKLKDDPRVTKVGKILRKTSLDEMPQLLNVLNGTMSLVGPRPYLLREKEDMGEYYNIIIKQKPGITGLWQVNGRSNTTFAERLDMDVMYYKKKSLKNDVVILFKTFANVFKKEGAV